MDELKGFLDGEGRLTQLPAKQRKRIPALIYLAGKFTPGRVYTEVEINELLCAWHTFRDPATLRRELYDSRFLDRTQDGREYRLADPQPTRESLERH